MYQGGSNALSGPGSLIATGGVVGGSTAGSLAYTGFRTFTFILLAMLVIMAGLVLLRIATVGQRRTAAVTTSPVITTPKTDTGDEA
jgi:hypothetical protein